jgi:hypothetical protein
MGNSTLFHFMVKEFDFKLVVFQHLWMFVLPIKVSIAMIFYTCVFQREDIILAVMVITKVPLGKW